MSRVRGIVEVVRIAIGELPTSALPFAAKFPFAVLLRANGHELWVGWERHPHWNALVGEVGFLGKGYRGWTKGGSG